MSTGSVYCKSVVSSSDISCASVSATNSSSTGSDTFEGVLGSAPNIVCQICQSLGHSAVSYHVRYQPKHTSTIPAMANFSPVEAAKSLWYQDSTAAAQMTPKEGTLSSLAPYSGSEKLIVGNGSLLPVDNIGSLTIKTRSKPLLLSFILHVP